jgi:hypothetical protein
MFQGKFTIFMVTEKQIYDVHIFTCHAVVLKPPLTALPFVLPHAGAIAVEAI